MGTRPDVVSSLRPSKGELLGLLVLFGYGTVLIVVLSRVGGFSGVGLGIGLQVAALPIGVAVGWTTYRDRAMLTPLVGVAPLLGCGVALALFGHVTAAVLVRAAPFATMLVGGFVVSWAVGGYVVGTALRWQRFRDRVAARELLTACGVVLVGTVLACVSYGVFWGYFVVGLGDQLA